MTFPTVKRRDLRDVLETILSIAYGTDADDIARDGLACTEPEEQQLSGLITRLQRHLRERRLALTCPDEAMERRIEQLATWSLAVEHSVKLHAHLLAAACERLSNELEHARTKLLMGTTADLLAELATRMQASRHPNRSGYAIALALVTDAIATWRERLHPDVAACAAATWLDFSAAVEAALPVSPFALAPLGHLELELERPVARIELGSSQPVRWLDRVRTRQARSRIAFESAADELVRSLGRQSRELVLDYLQLTSRRSDLVMQKLRRSARELERSSQRALANARRIQAAGGQAQRAVLDQIDHALRTLNELEDALVAN